MYVKSNAVGQNERKINVEHVYRKHVLKVTPKDGYSREFRELQLKSTAFIN